MSKSIIQEQQEILAVIDAHPEGLHRGQISDILNISIKDKTLQRRLATLIAEGKVINEGIKRGAKYFPAARPAQSLGTYLKDNDSSIFSQTSKNTLSFLDKPVHAREKVSYNRSFLEDYVPKETIYVPIDLRQRLQEEGKRFDEDLAAGTYARQISERLLIDLS